MFRTWLRSWRQRSARSSQSSPRSLRRRAFRFGIGLEQLEDRLTPAEHCWTGMINNLWSVAGNWDPGCAGSPVGDPDAVIRFTPRPSNFTSVNDLGNFTVAEIRFETNNIVLNSLPNTAIRLKFGITATAAAFGTNTIRSPLILNGPTVHIVDFQGNAPRTLALEGVISADSPLDSLAKVGSGDLRLLGDNTFDGRDNTPERRGGVQLFGSATSVPSILTVGHDHALGIGKLMLQGGTVRASSAVSLQNEFELFDDTIIGGNANLTFTANGTLTGVGKVLSIENYGTTTFSGTLSGPGGIAIDNERDSRIARGKAVLSGNNTYTFGTFVNTGILAVTTNTALGTGPLTLIGGQLQSDNSSGNGTFQTRRDFAVGTGPSAVTTADVNGDNRPDLITADATAGTVSVLLGNGDNTFQAARTFTVGASPAAVTAVDVNGDNLVDLITANATANTVSVLLGTGGGAFQAARTFAVGTGPSAVTVADVNGDGRRDLAIANAGSNSVSVLLGNGDGTYQAVRTFAVGTGPSGVAASDLNRDGRTDLITANRTANTVSVLWGLGDGTFQAARTFAADTGPSALVAADVNRDGIPDVVTANSTANTVSVLLGNGDGTLQSRLDFAVGTSPAALTATDLNGDGRPDLITANAGGNAVSVLLGNGDGQFQAARDFTAGTGPSGVAAADVNSDAIPDLITANRTGNNVSVLLGNPITLTNTWAVEGPGARIGGINGLTLTGNGALGGDGTFQAARSFSAGAGPAAVATGDLNGDGIPDLVTANATANTVSVLLGNGTGTFRPRLDFATGTGPTAVFIADVNGDGRPDLITANILDDTVSVLLSNGDGSFQVPRPFATGAAPSAVAVADVNGDGVLDLITADRDSDTVSVLLGNGDVTYQDARPFAVGAGPSALIARDINGDGRIDLVTANAGGNSVSVLLGNGNGTFQAVRNFVADAGPSALAIADVNSDSRLDLVTANAVGNSVSVFLGNGNGTFLAAQTFATGPAPAGLVIADLNRDGRLDLATANRGDATVTLLQGNGDGTFLATRTFAVGSGPSALAAADVNRDGRTDLITANTGLASVNVLLADNAILTLANTRGTISLTGQIFGAGSLVKTDIGAAQLTGNNFYSGNTTLRGGTLAVTDNNSLGTGQLELAGGTLLAEAPVTLPNTFVVTGDSGIGGSSNVIFSGPAVFTGQVTFTLTISNTAITTFTNVISGVGAIRIDAGANGIVNFFGISSYSGGTTLLSGTITVNSDRSLGVGVVTLNGGAIQANAAVTLPNAILVNGSTAITGNNNLVITGGVTLLAPANIFTIRNNAVTTFTSVINGSGQLALNAPTGTLNLPASNTYTGGITLTAGTLVGSNNLSFGTGPLNFNGGRLLPTAVLTLANAFTVNGNPIIDAALNITFTGFGNLIGGNLTIRNNAVVTFTHSAFINITGAGSITKVDGGTLVLTSNSDFRGGVTLNAGLLLIGHGNALGTGLFTVNGGTLRATNPVTVPNSVNVNGNATIDGAVNLTFGGGGTMTLAAGVTLTISNTAGTSINQVIRGAGGLTFTAGTGSLAAANTYTGPTTVTGGTLFINGTQAASAVSVAGATLGGVGTTGPITLVGGTLSPGVGPGQLRATGNVSLNSTSVLLLELNGTRAGTDFDQLLVTGVLDLNSDRAAGSRIELRPGFIPAVGASLTIVQTTGGVRGTFSGVVEGGFVVVGDLTFKVTYQGGASGGDIVLTRVLTNTTINLVSSLNPSNPGGQITFTAQVAFTGGATTSALTGTVTFLEGQNVLGVVPLVNGRAQLSTSLFTVGSYVISATYSGDGNFTPSGPAQLTQRVIPDLSVPVNRRFVAQLYRDLLGREADQAGLNGFAQLLDQNQITRVGVVLAIQASQEYRELVVRALYRRVLNREVDAFGLASWSDFLAKGGTADQLLVLLIDSQEFFQRLGGGTSNGFLQATYQLLLGRTIDNVGQQLWGARVTAGSPRGSIADEIVRSDESNSRRVDSVFRQFLRRAADSNGLNGFAAQLRAGATLDSITATILASEEYYLRA